MAKTHLSSSKEMKGCLPACTGARLEVASLETTKTRDGRKAYLVDFVIKEPKAVKGSHVRDFITIGTEDDPRAKQKETWERQEAGPGRINRLFTRAGIDLTDDDEEWDGLLTGSEVIAPITIRKDENDQDRNNVGKYFKETDDDCPPIGLAEDKKGGKSKAKGRPKPTDDDDEDADDDKPKGKKASKAEESDDDDEKPAKKKKADDDDDDDSDDDDDKPRRGRPKSKASKKAKDDEDDDE